MPFSLQVLFLARDRAVNFNIAHSEGKILNDFCTNWSLVSPINNTEFQYSNGPKLVFYLNMPPTLNTQRKIIQSFQITETWCLVIKSISQNYLIAEGFSRLDNKIISYYGPQRLPDNPDDPPVHGSHQTVHFGSCDDF